MAPLAAFVLSLHFFMQGLYSWSEAPPSGIERPHTTSVVPSVGEGEQPDLQDPAVTYACPLLLVRVPLVAPAPEVGVQLYCATAQVGLLHFFYFLYFSLCNLQMARDMLGRFGVTYKWWPRLAPTT